MVIDDEQYELPAAEQKVLPESPKTRTEEVANNLPKTRKVKRATAKKPTPEPLQDETDDLRDDDAPPEQEVVDVEPENSSVSFLE